MSGWLVIELAALAALICCSAFFSSAETALFSLNPIQVHRLGRRNPKAAARIESILGQPTHLLSTILIGNTLVNIAASSLGYAVAEHLFPGRGQAVAIPAMTAVLLLLGEVTPKRLAMSGPERLAVLYAPLLNVLIPAATPLRLGLEGVSSLLRKQIHARRTSLTEDEFMTVVEVGEEEGVLDEEERGMVDGIIGLEETQASDVMTPRVDLIGIDLEDPPDEQERVARAIRFRFAPLYRGTLDRIEGFLDVPHFLLSDQHDLAAATVPPFYVPENAPLDDLLATMQREHRRVAVVADEFGGTAGLITRGDILEEIAADVDNEYGEHKAEIQEVTPGRWLIDGSTSLEDINYELDLNLEAEGADRIAGWITMHTGHIPRAGESVEAQGCRVTVQRVRRQRITLVELEKRTPAAGAAGAGQEQP